MRQDFIIKITFLLLFSGGKLSGQSLSDSLLSYEYAVYKSAHDSVKQELILKKLALYFRRNITDENVFEELKRINPDLLKNSETKSSFLWNAAVVSYINGQTNHAMHYIQDYKAATKDSSLIFNLLSVLIHKYSDTGEVKRCLTFLSRKDPMFHDLNCFADVAAYERKHLNFYLVSSALIPGSGTIMNGYILKGLVSLALTSASVYGIVKLVEYGLYINAVLWGSGVGLKFYTGNIKLTEKSFYGAEKKKKNKLTSDCELKLKHILNKYPVTLKE
jgi:hypothetical protein